MLALYLAAMQSGLYLVTLNYHLTAPEVGYILADSGADGRRRLRSGSRTSSSPPPRPAGPACSSSSTARDIDGPRR